MRRMPTVSRTASPATGRPAARRGHLPTREVLSTRDRSPTTTARPALGNPQRVSDHREGHRDEVAHEARHGADMEDLVEAEPRGGGVGALERVHDVEGGDGLPADESRDILACVTIH